MFELTYVNFEKKKKNLFLINNRINEKIGDNLVEFIHINYNCGIS